MPAPHHPSPAALAALGRLREQASTRHLTSVGGYMWAEVPPILMSSADIPKFNRALRELEAASLFIPADNRNPALVRLPVTEDTQ